MPSAAARYRRGRRLSLLGLIVNAALAVTKLLAGILGHSTALIADAVESLTDIGGSLVVWRGLRVASRPADGDHPYGHGRAEAVAALIVALMLFAAAVAITVEAIEDLVGDPPSPAPFTLGVLLGVVAVKETLFRVVRRAARRSNSVAVLADAWHHRSDAITSLAAAVGVSIALIGGPAYAAADDWAALFAVLVICFNAYRLVPAPLHELMDKECPEIVAQVRAVAAVVPGVAEVEKVYARKSGLHYWIDMHVEVDPEMCVRDAHQLMHGIKDAIRLALPHVQDVLIHVEPHGGPGDVRSDARPPAVVPPADQTVELSHLERGP